jgi:SAM-dependent methyltransferase
MQRIVRARLGLWRAKPGAGDFWEKMPRTWLESFMGSAGSGREHPSRKFVADLIRPGERVLDAGCGAGVDFQVLLEAGKADGYVGVDRTEALVRLAHERYRYGDFRYGDVAELERLFGSASFDVVLMRHVLEHQFAFEPAMDQAICVARRLAVFVFYLTPRHLPVNIPKMDARPDLPYYVHIYSRAAILEYLDRRGLCWQWRGNMGSSRAGWLTGETNTVLIVSRDAGTPG